eukprot:3828428-Prymnesium_polylepis.1
MALSLAEKGVRCVPPNATQHNYHNYHNTLPSSSTAHLSALHIQHRVPPLPLPTMPPRHAPHPPHLPHDPLCVAILHPQPLQLLHQRLVRVRRRLRRQPDDVRVAQRRDLHL